MTEHEFHALLTESAPPFQITTTGGRSYEITDRSQVWAPDSAPDMFVLAIPGKGLRMLRVAAVESIRLEHGRPADYTGSVRHWTENR